MAANSNNNTNIQGLSSRLPRSPVDSSKFNELIQTVFAGFAPTYKNYLRGYDKNLRNSIAERDVFVQELLKRVDLLEAENRLLTQENEDLRDQVQSLDDTIFESGADLFDIPSLPNEEPSAEVTTSEDQPASDYIIQDDYFIF